MDQFDDLPEFTDKDTKPKFLTQFSNMNDNEGIDGPSGTINNGLQPIDWGESVTTQKDQIDQGDKIDANDAQDQDQKTINLDDK